jgi:hypothetical protein
MNTLALPFSAIARRAKFQTVECDCHVGHVSHVLQMLALSYMGHKVSLTLDDGLFNVRIDDDYGRTAIGLTFEGMVEFVERSVSPNRYSLP